MQTNDQKRSDEAVRGCAATSWTPGTGVIRMTRRQRERNGAALRADAPGSRTQPLHPPGTHPPPLVHEVSLQRVLSVSSIVTNLQIGVVTRGRVPAPRVGLRHAGARQGCR